ncbi:unnamed protein product [Caenorhabditis brenneri]
MRLFLLLICAFGILGCVATCLENSPENVTVTTLDSVLVRNVRDAQKEKKDEPKKQPAQQTPLRTVNTVLYGGVVPMAEVHYAIDDGAPADGTWSILKIMEKYGGFIIGGIILVICIGLAIFFYCRSRILERRRRQRRQQHPNMLPQQNRNLLCVPCTQSERSISYRTRSASPAAAAEVFKLVDQVAGQKAVNEDVAPPQEEAQALLDGQEPVKEEVREPLEQEKQGDDAQESRDQDQPKDEKQEPRDQDAHGAQEPRNQDPPRDDAPTPGSPTVPQAGADVPLTVPPTEPTGAQEQAESSPTESARSADVVVLIEDTPAADV